MITRRFGLVAAAALASVPAARAQIASKIRIGVLNDQSSVYSENGGAGSVACARQAIAEYASQAGLDVELVSADHQNKADIGLAIARQWFDDGVDVIADVQGSAIALAISGLVRERDKVLLACNVGVSDLTGAACSPNCTHWAYDSQMLGRALGTALTRRGNKTWFCIRADYSFGKALQDDTVAAVERNGGKLVGSIAMPFPSADFSAALVQAQSSRAQIIALGNGGSDLVNAIKQAGEFGVMQNGQSIVALLMFINNVHALGLDAAKGLTLCNTFYWDANDQTRDFSKRVVASGFNARAKPNMSQAANYSAVKHYLKAVAATGAVMAKRSGAVVVARMKATSVEDDVLGHATIRPDGRVVSPVFLYQVKQPSESRGSWDYYKLIATVMPDDAWRPIAEGGCPFILGR